MFDFSIVTQWIHSMLTSFMPEGLAVFIECVAIGVCIMLAYAVIAIHYDIHGAKSLCSIPVSPRTDARRTLGHHTGLCRCIQDVDKESSPFVTPTISFITSLPIL